LNLRLKPLSSEDVVFKIGLCGNDPMLQLCNSIMHCVSG